MAYGVKYQTSYKRRSNGLTTITISEKNYSSTVTTLVADATPLEITVSGDVNNVYQPTKGSGATLRLMVTPLTMLGLFTTDPQKYKMKVYSGTTGGTLIWQGFINTGIYQEDYSIGGTQLVPITLEANDGMALLDDLSYKVSETGATYQGAQTISAVLNNIFSKLGLTFSNIITSSDLSVAAGVTNLFTGLYVNNENYLDEEGVSMSCREVLDTIFQPLGLVMSFRADKIYLIDPINLHSTAFGKSYNATGGTETVISTLGGYLDISATGSTKVGYYSTGSVLDVVQPYNQIQLKYDPYTYTGDGYDLSEVGNFTGGTFVVMTGASAGYIGNYWWNSGVTFNNWTMADGAIGWGEKPTSVLNDASADYYMLRKIRGDTSGTFTYTFPYSGIKQDDNLLIELSMDVFINTRHYVNIVNPTEASVPLKSLYINNVEIKVGNRWWNGTTQKWQDSQFYGNKILVRQLDAEVLAAYRVHGTWFRKAKYYAAEDQSVINDKWTTTLYYIPLSELSCSNVGLLSGDITIKIYTGVDVTNIITPWAGSADNWYRIHNVLTKNINVSLVRLDKTPISNDGVMTVVNLDNATTRKKTPYSIKLKNGCGLWGASKGAYSSTNITPSGSNITGLIRNSTVSDTAILLGQNLISQYNEIRYKLSASLDASTRLLSLDKYLIKDSKAGRLGTRAFYIASGVYNDEQESFNADMIEITATRET